MNIQDLVAGLKQHNINHMIDKNKQIVMQRLIFTPSYIEKLDSRDANGLFKSIGVIQSMYKSMRIQLDRATIQEMGSELALKLVRRDKVSPDVIQADFSENHVIVPYMNSPPQDFEFTKKYLPKGYDSDSWFLEFADLIPTPKYKVEQIGCDIHAIRCHQADGMLINQKIFKELFSNHIGKLVFIVSTLELGIVDKNLYNEMYEIAYNDRKKPNFVTHDLFEILPDGFVEYQAEVEI